MKYGEVPRQNVTDVLERRNVPDYLVPILLAVRDHGLIWISITHGPDAFFDVLNEIPLGRNFLLHVGDDMPDSMGGCQGPSGFHTESLVQLIKRTTRAAIVSAAGTVEVYGTFAAIPTQMMENAVIIETRVDHEIEWVELYRRVACDNILLVTTKEHPA